jgi:rhodanese-related sulfurtransferase
VAERITLDEVKRLQEEGAPYLMVDVRTERSYRDDQKRAAGALRLPPDDAVRLARERRLDPDATLVLYCA